jgi:GGDEF domain-containing protein
MSAGRPRKAANILRGELPDGEVVVSLAGGERALILNSTADAVLALCDGSRTIDEIAHFVRDTLSIPAGTDVVHDIASVVDELARAGIVVTVA